MITGQWVYCILFSFVCINYGCYAQQNPIYQWGPWSSLPLTCSVTCGRGVRCRVRKCLDNFGKVQSSTELCANPEDFESKAESCTTCVVRSRCPRLPGWSAWSAWSRCLPREEGKQVRAPNGCLIGMRLRSRKCDNPSPEPPPFGIPCTGSSRQTSECSYGCDERPDITPDDVAKQVHLQVESDHKIGLRSFQTVLRKHVGEQAKMDCATPAYRLAKRLTVGGSMFAGKRGFGSKNVYITWYRNGQKVETTQPESKMPKFRIKKFSQTTTSTNTLLDEELRWMSLLQPSPSYVEGEWLILSSVAEGDQGFYTCELHVGEYKWTTIFYSLIVIGVRYVAQATDPFYLHSNLGFSNALTYGPVWLEAAQIVWTRNGLFQSRGLAARLSRRIQKIDHLNYTHQGTWSCFLIVPASGPMSRVSQPGIRVAGSYLINEFHLKVTPTGTSLWQMAEHPSSIRILRHISVTLSVICLFLVLFLLLTIWAARRWIHRSLSVEQTHAIVQELVDNECRLMLTARKRATINKDRLLPLILQEHQRLERTNRHLNERLAHRITMRKQNEDIVTETTDAKTTMLNIKEQLGETFTKLMRTMSSQISPKGTDEKPQENRVQDSNTQMKDEKPIEKPNLSRKIKRETETFTKLMKTMSSHILPKGTDEKPQENRAQDSDTQMEDEKPKVSRKRKRETETFTKLMRTMSSHILSKGMDDKPQENRVQDSNTQMEDEKPKVSRKIKRETETFTKLMRTMSSHILPKGTDEKPQKNRVWDSNAQMKDEKPIEKPKVSRKRKRETETFDDKNETTEPVSTSSKLKARMPQLSVIEGAARAHLSSIARKIRSRSLKPLSTEEQRTSPAPERRRSNSSSSISGRPEMQKLTGFLSKRSRK